jgi:hypothetical protein
MAGVVVAISVEESLENVTRSDSSAAGTGEFTATLTHYRALLFGACRTFSATVRGTITSPLTPRGLLIEP